MAQFSPYSSIIDDGFGCDQQSQQLVNDEESEQLQHVPETQKKKIFVPVSSKKNIAIRAAIMALFFLTSIFVLWFLISHFNNTPDHREKISSDTKFVATPNITDKDDYSGLDGRLCRIVNVGNSNLVVNVHRQAMHDGSFAISFDKGELQWNSQWKVVSTRGGVRFEVTSASGLMKVLAEDVNTNKIVVSHLEQSTVRNVTTTDVESASNQVWILIQQSSGTLRIKNQKSGRCLKSNGSPNQLSTTVCDNLEDKSCQWNISVDMIWNKWSKFQDIPFCTNSTRNV